MDSKYEVVIVGAGIIGLSVAYQLKKRGCRSVLVLEKENSWITGSSARANGGFRQQFSTPINIQLSQISLSVFQRFEDEFETDISFRQHGYLFLTATEAGCRALDENLVFQRQWGVPVRRLSGTEILEIAPYAQTDDIMAANFCPQDGYADSYSISAGFGNAAIQLGAHIQTGAEVTQIVSHDGRVQGVVADGRNIETNVVVNAAGPYARHVGKSAGIDIPVDPVRRMLLITEPFDGIAEDIPMTIDVDTGFFMRKESGRVLMGWSDPSEPVSFNMSFDPNHIDDVAERALSRIPILTETEINPKKCWAGLYSVTPDHHCILGEAPQLKGFYLANGFSGHGMMHSPAVGLILADLILEGRTSLVDIHPLRLSRFEEGDLIHEQVVI